MEYYNDRFLETAYLLCPDVRMMADAMSDDGKWAVRIYPKPLNSYIFYKDNHGRKRILKNSQILYTMDSIRQLKPGSYECVQGAPYPYPHLRHTSGGGKKGRIYFSSFGKFEITYD